MVRPSDSFWDYVNKQDGALSCKFCGFQYASGSSVSRVKAHLSGVRGRGVTICTSSPPEVQEAAYNEIMEKQQRKRHKPDVGTSSNDASGLTALTSNGVGKVTNNFPRLPVPEGVSSLEIPGNPVREEIRHEDVSRKQQMVDDSGADKLLTEELIGQAFAEYLPKIQAWLNEEGVSCIGIYGMGGVGKTTVAMHIYNRLLENQCGFQCLWVTVSLDSSIHRLQSYIGRNIGLDLSSEDEEIKRAAKLHSALSRKHNTVLFLDDLWNIFYARKVGIPFGTNQFKLIITTRSLDVCRRMCCDKIIKLEPLSEVEGLELFMRTVGNNDCMVEPLAKSLAIECGGLPLALTTIARYLRGVDDPCEWKNALREVKEAKFRPDDIGSELFSLLRFSYSRLSDLALQQCFLYCALFPEDFTIDRKELIGLLVDVGIIEAMRSRQEQFDKGHAMLNKLQNVCLLESESGSSVRLHDVVRDMALQELRWKFHALVACGDQLQELPDMEKWTEDLVIVSLMQNDIKEIPSSHSPRCPSLSTLLLCRNYSLKSVPNTFFLGFCGLNVLDLSYTAIQVLPDSISDLVTLRALCARHCQELQYVPSLERLTALKKLDLNFTALEEVPRGIECLSKLHYLDLYGTHIKQLPSGILSKLSHLQVLVLASWWDDTGENEDLVLPSAVTAKVEEVTCLKKLEDLRCYFRDIEDLNILLKSWKGGQPLNSYTLLAGGMDEQAEEIRQRSILFHTEAPFVACFKKIVCLCNFYVNGEGELLALPKDMQELVVVECYDTRSLCGISSLEQATELKSLSIGNCERIECLLSGPLDAVEQIEYLYLYRLLNLHALVSREGAGPSPWPSRSTFSFLKKLLIWACSSIKTLLTPALVQNLQNLESLEVINCPQMEEIIEEESSSSGSGNNRSLVIRTEFSLPKLWRLDLDDLPKLKSICHVKLRCNIECIFVRDCKKLERMPPSFLLRDDCPQTPLPSLQKIIIPEDWWESVAWYPPHAKNVLRPFVNLVKSNVTIE